MNGVQSPGPEFSARVIDWQRVHGRNTLPWQNTRDPYRVWLSEVMLQQTQVATVLDYYQRFLQRFPDVRALAEAPLDDVLALWSGLGYYSRARNLYRCAQVVTQTHGGVFPNHAEGLEQLPGIGRSTAAAIAAFCFGERVAILDGNVKRVLSRVLAFEGDLGQQAQERRLWGLASELLPDAGIERYTQGLMDLGATICLTRQPACGQCPVQTCCVASGRGEAIRYPIRTRKTKRHRRETIWLWLSWKDHLWLLQRPASGIWSGLWSLPEFESENAFQLASSVWAGQLDRMPPLTHQLTHVEWTLHPVRWHLPTDMTSEAVACVTNSLGGSAGRWFELSQALGAGLPAPLRKLLLAEFPQGELLL